MAELGARTAEADARWAKAGRYAQGFADNGMGEALRIYYTRYFPAGVVLYIGALALIVPLLSGGEPTDWGSVLQFGSFLFALLAAVAGFTYNASGSSLEPNSARICPSPSGSRSMSRNT